MKNCCLCYRPISGDCYELQPMVASAGWQSFAKSRYDNRSVKYMHTECLLNAQRFEQREAELRASLAERDREDADIEEATGSLTCRCMRCGLELM